MSCISTTTIVFLSATQTLLDMIVVDSSCVINQVIHQNLLKTAIRCLIQKLDRKLIPFIVLLEISSFINRVTISHSKLMGLQTDLNMSESESDWAISLFYLGDMIFSIPSVWLLRLLGPSRYLSASMIAWGSITIGLAFVRSARELLVVRFFLGVAIAGYFPGIVLYFSLWYRKREQIMRITILTAAASASGAVDGFLVCAISRMGGIGGLQTWRWAFLLEGLPIVLLGFITYLFLNSVPDAVRWLDSGEKLLLSNLLRADAVALNVESNKRLSWREIYAAFADRRIYLYAAIGIVDLGLIKCLTALAPRIVANMGFSTTGEYLMTAPPYAVASIFCLVSGYMAARRNEHSFHLIFCLLIDLLGFILMIVLFDKGTAAVYVGLCLAFCGTFSALPLLLSWLTNNIRGNTKRATAVALLLGSGQIVGVLTPLIYRDMDKPSYRQGHLICAGMLIASVVVTIILRNCLMAENLRRQNLVNLPEQYNREIAVKVPCDSHPDIIYAK